MLRTTKPAFLFTGLSLAFVAHFCWPNPSYAASDSTVEIHLPKGCSRPSQIIIQHTNDHHGSVYGKKTADGDQYGLARQATLVRDQQKADIEKLKCPAHLLLSAGDVMSGDIASDVLDNRPDFAAMAKIGYAGMTLGNHDFDHGLDTLNHLVQKETRFPVLSANAYDPSTQKTLYNEYVLYPIKDDQGKTVQTIAVIGLTAESTGKNAITEEEKKRIQFRNPIETANSVIEKIKKTHKVDHIILLTHLGGSQKDEYQGAASSRALAKGLKHEVDLIIDGHEHEKLEQPVRVPGTENRSNTIVSAGESGQYVGHVVLPAESSQLNDSTIQVSLTRINRDIPEDPEINKLLARYRKDGKASRYFRTVFENSPVFFEGDRSIVKQKSTNLSRFLNDATAFCGKADVSFITPSSVRTSVFPGRVTEGDLANVSPYTNENATVTMATVTGSQLAEIVDFAERKAAGKAPFFYFSDALTKATDGQISIQGAPLDPSKTYRVAAVYWLFKEVLGNKYASSKVVKNGHPYVIADCIVDYAKSFASSRKKTAEFYAKYTLPAQAAASVSPARAVSDSVKKNEEVSPLSVQKGGVSAAAGASY